MTTAAKTPILSGEWWRDKASLEYAIAEHGPSNKAVARATGVSEFSIRKWRGRLGIAPSFDTGGGVRKIVTRDYDGADDTWLVDLIKKNGDTASVEQLANSADVSPKRIREALDRLGEGGYRISEEDRGVVLHRVAPDKTQLHPGLFDGEELTFGVVSDTHLGSNEEALDELHLAYDIFEQEGVTEVLHAGDLTCGLGIFRGQAPEIKIHTLDNQVKYAVENYPERAGIRTRMISGNHDLEGDAGKVGFDPVAAVAREREDIEYLGAYSAWLGVHGGGWIHLLHGKGGMSYAYSYKAQKLVEGYPGGRKPSILIPGHWHVQANFMARGVRVMFPGCFEWQSRFMQRLGLQPAVGFHIIHCTFADDGSLVQFTPRWFQYFEGRTVEAVS